MPKHAVIDDELKKKQILSTLLASRRIGNSQMPIPEFLADQCVSLVEKTLMKEHTDKRLRLVWDFLVIACENQQARRLFLANPVISNMRWRQIPQVKLGDSPSD